MWALSPALNGNETFCGVRLKPVSFTRCRSGLPLIATACSNWIRKSFEPTFAVGDRLNFMLRANATVARGSEKGKRGKPCDVVMDTIFKVPAAERADRRRTAVEESGRAWLARQGELGGFAVDVREIRVPSYQVLRVEHSGPKARLGVLDLEGALTVTDPAIFIERVRAGFGRAKAFGCGLMLLRRV